MGLEPLLHPSERKVLNDVDHTVLKLDQWPGSMFLFGDPIALLFSH